MIPAEQPYSLSSHSLGSKSDPVDVPLASYDPRSLIERESPRTSLFSFLGCFTFKCTRHGTATMCHIHHGYSVTITITKTSSG